SMSTDDSRPELNPNLDRALMAQTFARTGRVQIADVLTDASAQRLRCALEQETPWGLILNDGKKVLEYDTVSAEDYKSMAIAAWNRAHSGFQYFYHHYRLLENRTTYPAPDHYLTKLVAFLTSPDFFVFIRQITGFESIAWISSSATLYKPLDFLTVHDDGLDGGKLVAYVLNMTPEWQPDWGGALQFFDRDDHIEEAYLPTFNALNLFRVPKRHSVNQVAAFGGLRYSVSGWFLSEHPDRVPPASP
ncbi:MAG: 2OG-Fe(II) oxygenase, partial [Sulfobacillus sp.]